MNTRHAEYEGALDRLRADMAQRDAEAAQRDASRDAELGRLRADIARRGEEAAKDGKDNLRFHIGLWIAAVVVLGVLIRWPG